MRKAIIVLVSMLLVVFLAVPAALAEEPPERELTMDEAIARALDRSEDVRKAQTEIDRAKIMRDYYGDQLDYVPDMPPGSAAVEVPWATFLQSDLTWQMSKRSLGLEEDRVALEACRRYLDVLEEQEKMRTSEASLNSALRQLQNARVSYHAGVLSRPQLVQVEELYNMAESGVKSAQHALDDAYESLNQLLGLRVAERPELTSELEFAPLEIPSLNYEVTRALDRAPSVWLAKEQVTLQRFLEDMMFYTGEYRPYQARKIEVRQAEIDARSARNALELATRELYYTLRALEEAYQMAQSGITVAEEDVRVARIRNQVGLNTRAEVVKAEAELIEARQQAHELAAQHAYMKLAFQKPWALQR